MIGQNLVNDPSMPTQRQRLAEAIMKATGAGEPQEVQHPMQAIANAAQQIAAAHQKRKSAVQLPGAMGKPGPAIAKPVPLPQARPPSSKPPPLRGSFFKPYRS